MIAWWGKQGVYGVIYCWIRRWLMSRLMRGDQVIIDYGSSLTGQEYRLEPVSAEPVVNGNPARKTTSRWKHGVDGVGYLRYLVIRAGAVVFSWAALSSSAIERTSRSDILWGCFYWCFWYLWHNMFVWFWWGIADSAATPPCSLSRIFLLHLTFAPTLSPLSAPNPVSREIHHQRLWPPACGHLNIDRVSNPKGNPSKNNG